jgi:hypothetical protein
LTLTSPKLPRGQRKPTLSGIGFGSVLTGVG